MTDKTGITRVQTLGSVVVIDNDLNRYLRFPKHEGPRERPEWSDERAGALQDAVWHDFTGEWVINALDCLVLKLGEPNEEGLVPIASFPMAVIEGETA